MAENIFHFLVSHRTIPARRDFHKSTRTAEHWFFRLNGSESNQGMPSLGNRDLFPLEGTFNQARELSLRFVNIDFHASMLANSIS